MNTLRAQSPIRLSWTHYRIILQESNKEARDWYEQEAAREMWGTRTLQRNVSSQYYHRLLQSQNKDAVRGEMKQLTAPLQDKLEYIKNPVVAEFLVRLLKLVSSSSTSEAASRLPRRHCAQFKETKT